jgi:phospholipid/cholesterol/gamma-HCH transport system substrate-binding protein
VSAHSTEEARKTFRVVVSIAIVAVLGLGATTAVRAAYGAFSDDLTVRTQFPRAGQALRSGSDVKYRGVNVGKVGSIRLVDRQAEVVLELRKDVTIPADTEASVRAKTLFGEKYVELSERPDRPPYLSEGDVVASAGTGLEVEDLLDTTDHLLRGIDAAELATLMDELVQASHGEGERVAHLIDRGTEAAASMVDSLEAQVRAIDSFARFAQQYRDIGPLLNGINANLNELLPTFNAARDDYERLLVTLRPFADRLAALIEVNEADLGRLLDDGDNIVRVLTARKENISEVIVGLDTYTATLADAISPGTLPDGSRYGNMKIFIDFGELRDLLCTVLEPTELGTVRDALAARVPELACPVGGGSGPPSPGGAPASPSSPSSPPSPPAQPAPDPVGDLLAQLASPDLSTTEGTVGDLLIALAGEDR